MKTICREEADFATDCILTWDVTSYRLTPSREQCTTEYFRYLITNTVNLCGLTDVTYRQSGENTRYVSWLEFDGQLQGEVNLSAAPE
jgi:hypothetical protein